MSHESTDGESTNGESTDEEDETFLTTLHATIDLLDQISDQINENTYLKLVNKLHRLYTIYNSSTTMTHNITTSNDTILPPSENTVTQLTSSNTTDTINDTILTPSENTVTQLTSSNTTDTINDTILSPSENTVTQLPSSNTTDTINDTILSPSENTVTLLTSSNTTNTINDTILPPSENIVTPLTSSNTTNTNSTINVISLASLYNDSDGRGVYPRYNSLIEEIQAKFWNLQYMWRHFSPEQRAEYALNDNYNRDYHNINSDFNFFWQSAKNTWDDWLTINQREVCRRTIYENDSPVWRIMNPRYN